MTKRRKPANRKTTAGWLLIVLFLLSLFATHPALLILLAIGGGSLAAWRMNARRRQNQALASQQQREAEIYAARALAIGTYYTMSGREFESALAYLCRRDGCREAQVTGGAGDLGADVVAITPDGRKLVIQAKRYAAGSLVTGPELQKFGGTCYQVHRAGVAAVVTTSGYTRQAREYAAMMRIVLFDNDALAGWAARDGAPPWGVMPPQKTFS